MNGTKCKLTMMWVVVLLWSSLVSQPANAQFVHPGGLHTQADLDRMKTKVAAGAHPWIDDWNVLTTDPLAQNTYTPHAMANPGNNRQLADQDAHAAYLNAIRWYVSGDVTYANNAVKILNAWASTVNQVPTGTDIPGLIGISIQDFALAGEVLRIYPGWASADFAKFQSMFTNYLYPVVNNFLTNHNGTCISSYWANWDAANTGALIAMGVLNDNSSWFNQGVTYYQSGPGNGSIANAIDHLWPGNLGQWQEAGRDQEHDQLGVGLLSYAAQTAWNQGVDLFGYSNNRLLAGAEYTAQYNLWLPVPYASYNNCDDAQQYYVSINGRGRLDDRPVWELVYNHYAVLQGISTPNSQNMAQLQRPEHGSSDHFGYGTLTFTLDASASAYPPSPIPVVPTGLTASGSVKQVYLSWPRVDTANGYTVLRATVSGGPYTKLSQMTQSTAPQYTDTTAAIGMPSYYVVQAVNQSGTSNNSVEVSATAVASSPLPLGSDSDVGVTQATGSASYSTVGKNTFLVTGQGSNIDGTTDSFHYAYQKVTGDFTLIARLTGISGNLQNTGLMMRESLAANATAVTMALGSTGGRIAHVGTRSNTGGNTIWVTGDQYTWLPVWFQLQRSGNVFTASQSSDGQTWFEIESNTVAMASTYYVGLVACSGDVTGATLETSTFDNASFPVKVTPTVQLVSSSPTTTTDSAVTFTTTVLPPTGDTTVPTGTVTVYDGTTVLNVATVPSTNSVSFTTSALAVGNHTIAAAYSGDFFFSPVSPSITEVITSSSQTQTISFTPPSSVAYGSGPITLSATATSGLPVSFSVVSGPAIVSGSTLTFNGVGTVVVAANQAGNTTYAAAPQVTENIAVGLKSQSINLAALPSSVAYGSGSITLSATATSGLPVSFSVVSGPATVSGSTLTFTGVGTVVVAANQAGNTTYAAALQVSASVVVGQSSQSINFAALPSSVTYGSGPITLSATATSGLPVSFSVVSGPATVSGSTLTFTGGGSVVLAANQAGNANYAAAPTVTATLTVVAAPDFSLSSSVSAAAIISGASTTIPFTVTAVNGFAQAVTFSCSAPSAAVTCTFNPPVLTPTTGTTSAQVSVQYSASTAQRRDRGHSQALLGVLGLLVGGWGFGGRLRTRHWNNIRLGLLFVVLLSLSCLSGCGCSHVLSTTNQGLTVTAVSGTITHTMSVELTLTDIQ